MTTHNDEESIENVNILTIVLPCNQTLSSYNILSRLRYKRIVYLRTSIDLNYLVSRIRSKSIGLRNKSIFTNMNMYLNGCSHPLKDVDRYSLILMSNEFYVIDPP